MPSNWLLLAISKLVLLQTAMSNAFIIATMRCRFHCFLHSDDGSILIMRLIAIDIPEKNHSIVSGTAVVITNDCVEDAFYCRCKNIHSRDDVECEIAPSNSHNERRSTGNSQQLKVKIFRFISPCPLKKCVAITQVCTRTPEANKTLSGILVS